MQVVDEIRNYNFNALKFLLEICQVLKEYPDVLPFIHQMYIDQQDPDL